MSATAAQPQSSQLMCCRACRARRNATHRARAPLQELSVPLGRFVKAFPLLPSLHPFEAALLDLSVGAATYASVLGKVDALRKSLQQVC